MWRIIMYYFCGQIMEDNLFYSLLLFRQFLCTFGKLDWTSISAAWILWRSWYTESLWRIMRPNHGDEALTLFLTNNFCVRFVSHIWQTFSKFGCQWRGIENPVYKKGKDANPFTRSIRQIIAQEHKLGHSEPAPTSAPSRGCLLCLSCGWSSTELLLGFILVTHSIRSRSNI
jgi:hypothetical protein